MAQLGVECLNLDRILTNDIKTEEDLERLLNTKNVEHVDEPIETVTETNVEDPIEEPIETNTDQNLEEIVPLEEPLENMNPLASQFIEQPIEQILGKNINPYLIKTSERISILEMFKSDLLLLLNISKVRKLGILKELKHFQISYLKMIQSLQ